MGDAMSMRGQWEGHHGGSSTGITPPHTPAHSTMRKGGTQHYAQGGHTALCARGAHSAVRKGSTQRCAQGEHTALCARGAHSAVRKGGTSCCPAVHTAPLLASVEVANRTRWCTTAMLTWGKKASSDLHQGPYYRGCHITPCDLRQAWQTLWEGCVISSRTHPLQS